MFAALRLIFPIPIPEDGGKGTDQGVGLIIPETELETRGEGQGSSRLA